MDEPPDLLLALDQGTSSTKALLLRSDFTPVGRASVPVATSSPRPGWVEQDAVAVADSVIRAATECVASSPHPVGAIGLSSQRESVLIWDRRTGQPLGPLLGWQDRRTAEAAARLVREGFDPLVRQRSGLPIDPMFSALKLRWLLDTVTASSSVDPSFVMAGTVDSWLMYRLTGQHRIEVGNASRTQLLDIHTGQWDPDLLAVFGVPEHVLPVVEESTAASPVITGIPGLAGRRITGVMADSHAALFAHAASTPGAVKVTYGTGSSVMGVTSADTPVSSGLVRTIAWHVDGPVHAFEGNILSSGATVVWLADILGVTPADIFELAAQAEDRHGEVSLVPAFEGLGAPWWDQRATAHLSGFTLGTNRADLARAAAESIALQVEDVLRSADEARSQRLDTVMVDGGPAANPWLLQLQADVSQRTVIRADVTELSATGAAMCAALGAGLASPSDLSNAPVRRQCVHPRPGGADADRAKAWSQAVSRARGTRTTPATPLGKDTTP